MLGEEEMFAPHKALIMDLPQNEKVSASAECAPGVSFATFQQVGDNAGL